MAYGARKRPKDGIHRVVEGDTISSIAASYGFTDWEAKVWNAPENATLQQQRVNPNTLVPGDEVFIPELLQKQEPRPTDAWHDFHVVRNKRLLRLKLQNENGEPLANRPYTITPEASFRGTYVQQNPTTDADGLIQEEIPHTMLEAELALPEDNLRTRLRIGYLLPLPMTEPVEAPELDPAGLAGDVIGAVSGGGVGNLAGGVGGSLSGAASGSLGVNGGALSGGADGAGDLAGGAKSAMSSTAKVGLATATAAAGPIGSAISGVLDAAFGDDEDPSILSAAQRLESMGFKPGRPKDNKRTPQFSAALIAFQTWCKEKALMPEGAGGPLGGLTAPGGALGGAGGALGAMAGSVAGPALAAVGLTGQLDEPTIEALKETHGC